MTQLAHVSVLCPSSFPIADDYYHSVYEHEMESVRMFARRFLRSKVRRDPGVGPTPGCDVYIDLMGGKYSWAQAQQTYIQNRLRGEFSYLRVYSAKRFLPAHTASRSRHMASARRDLAHLKSARVAVFSADSAEMEPGAATLLGYAYQKQKRIVYIYSPAVCYSGAGGQKMRGNLMLEQAASAYASGTSEAVAAILQLWHDTDV